MQNLLKKIKTMKLFYLPDGDHCQKYRGNEVGRLQQSIMEKNW